MFKRLATILRDAFASDEEPENTGAHAEDKEAPHYHHDKRALKDQFTNHWDLDTMTHAELEEYARQQKHNQDNSD